MDTPITEMGIAGVAVGAAMVRDTAGVRVRSFVMFFSPSPVRTEADL